MPFFVVGQCISSCEVTQQGNGIEGYFYNKSTMNLINGCVETMSYTKSGFQSGGGRGKRYLQYRLTIKNGKLKKVMSYHPSGQLMLKCSINNDKIIKKQCFNEKGDFVNCSEIDNYRKFGFPMINPITGDQMSFILCY